MYTVYILQSEKSGKFYVGFAADLLDRLSHHNSGATKSTAHGRPWKVIHSEQYQDKHTAWLRERQIKSYKGGSAFKKLIAKSGEVA